MVVEWSAVQWRQVVWLCSGVEAGGVVVQWSGGRWCGCAVEAGGVVGPVEAAVYSVSHQVSVSPRPKLLLQLYHLHDHTALGHTACITLRTVEKSGA